MSSLRPSVIALASWATLLLASAAMAQNAFNSADDREASDGLQNATPSDNVGELGNSKNGTGDLGSDFDNTGGDSLFGNAPVENNGGGNKATSEISAFGNGAANVSNAAKPPATNPSMPANAAAANALPAAAPPLNTPPTAPVAPVAPMPANAAFALPGENAAANAPTEHQAGAVAPPEEAPVIAASPLPPANDFAGAPPVPGTRRIMAEGEAPQEYLVQPGDTLFDICDQLLSEAAYWPKLWALNPDIKNPHFIFPNMKLRFYPGDDETPPYLQVVSEDDIIPIDKGDLDEQVLVAEKVIYKQENFEERPPIEVIGPSEVDALSDEILMGGKPYDGTHTQLQVPGFILANELTPLAHVIGGREGEISLAPGGRAIVEAVGEIASGTVYTVVRPGESIQNPETEDFVGFKYYFVGNVRVSKKIGDASYVVTMLGNNRLTLREDDILVAFKSTNRVVATTGQIGALSAAAAHIVGFQYDGGEFAGAGQFVFLDKGSSDGVAPGQYYPVFQTPGFTGSMLATDLPQDYEQIGVVTIIDATEVGACAYVVRNLREIRIGDRTNNK